jgi:hypothetical protein
MSGLMKDQSPNLSFQRPRRGFVFAIQDHSQSIVAARFPCLRQPVPSWSQAQFGPTLGVGAGLEVGLQMALRLKVHQHQ